MGNLNFMSGILRNTCLITGTNFQLASIDTIGITVQYVVHLCFCHCLQKKKQQKKKTQLKFTVDCTHPVEDGIMDVANFVSTVTVLFSSIQMS